MQGGSSDVYVSRSTGQNFMADNQIWHDSFAPPGQLPLSGDVNGDGKADVVAFTRGGTGDVYVALSTGAGFQAATLWHDYFAVNAEIPAVGDVNGDGKDDIVVFTQGSSGDVYVALSNGSKFGDTPLAPLWHDYFAVDNEIPGIGDFDGDGKDDIIVFVRGNGGQVHVAPSNGARFSATPRLWHPVFAPNSEVPAPRLIP